MDTLRRVGLLSAAIFGLASLSPPASARTDAAPRIEVLSNRADLVSGGDVLVGVTPRSAATPLRVHLNGRDVTDRFARRPGGRFAAVLTGLHVGENVIAATAGRSGARLIVTNHPLGGPIFSGPQLQPWYCLPDALDEQCSRKTTFSYSYKSSVTNLFAPFDPDSPPPDVATTTTDAGEDVPYIVRVETGIMARSQYRIAVLADPEHAWTRWTGPPAWNHKVYVPHGAGCGMGHSEGAAPDVLLDQPLSRGFAVMSTALEHNTENCNVVVQAESVMMAKEHLVETYGDIRYLFGVGSSGGSMAQLHMANAYPGLYDGLTVGATFPDVPTNDLLDCAALRRYFSDPGRWAPGVIWTEAQESAVGGHASTSVCRVWLNNFANMFDPRVGVECDVPAKEPGLVYDPVSNPKGVRCSFQDYLANVFGTRSQGRWGPAEKQIHRGFANRPYDNVGVQYGLRALLAGDITPGQFADLNAKVGAVDIDYGSQAARVEADPAAVTAVYRSGVLNEANHLDRVAIIDIPVPGDRYEIHDNYKSWALRARLDAANGHHDNHAIWYGPDERGITPAPALPEAFNTMDAWLTAIERDRRDVPLERKVAENRPTAASDRCGLVDRSVCNRVFGPAANPRWGAGAMIANDVVKCRLKPPERSDYYPTQLSDSEWATLREAFPTGVCDWSRPGVRQQPTVAWQTYADSSGGRPLGPRPRSSTCRARHCLGDAR